MARKSSGRFRASARGILRWLALAGLAPFLARADQAIYTDSLQNGWGDWGWAAVNYSNPSPVHSGAKSISVTINNAWEAIYIGRNAGLNPSPNNAFGFWVNGGSVGGQQLSVKGLASGAVQGSFNLPPLSTNTWQLINVPLMALGLADRADVTGFWLQDRIGRAWPTFYLDDISFMQGPVIELVAPTNYTITSAPGSVNASVNVIPNGHTINSVQYYNGTNLIGQATVAPYAFNWNNLAAGIYSLSARLIYDATSTVSSLAAIVVAATNEVFGIEVDAQANPHPISPLIYGVAFASSNQLAELNSPLNRSGGNSETRYNWLTNAHNHAADWYFESIADASASPGAAADDHVANSDAGGAQAALTVPMIGWAPKLGTARGKLASYSIAKYGPQTDHDSSMTDAGNGKSSTNHSAAITWNNPNDANFAVTSAFQQAWLQHLTNTWGVSTNGGVRYYLMDNEHSIWHSTHQDIHPTGATMAEIRDKFFDYAGMVKRLDPNALVGAPEEWGWSGYFFSGYDQQWSGQQKDYNASHFPDRSTNGGWDYCPWLLNQCYQRAASTGQRLLDYFTLHCYPQAGESGDDVSAAMQLLRNRSTRQLWDANYVDASWIGQQATNTILRLIPRMKAWVAAYYPGTKIGITEYNWGAEGSINGATAQADILGIFGREGLDLATRWTVPAAGAPASQAIKMYRNYDGNKSTFGDLSVKAAAPYPDAVSAFAALRSSDGALTIMAVNKQLTTIAQLVVSVTNFVPAGDAHAWQLTGANVIRRLPDLPLAGALLANALPPQSITLFVLPGGSVPRLSVAAFAADALSLRLDGAPGRRYVIQSSANLETWAPVQTNTLATNFLVLPPFPATNAAGAFYRAQWTGL